MRDENSTIELIKRYKELLDAGAITQAEFEQKKTALLNAGPAQGEHFSVNDPDDASGEGEINADGFVYYDDGVKRDMRRSIDEAQKFTTPEETTSLLEALTDSQRTDPAPVYREGAYKPAERYEPREPRSREQTHVPRDRGYYGAQLPAVHEPRPRGQTHAPRDRGYYGAELPPMHETRPRGQTRVPRGSGYYRAELPPMPDPYYAGGNKGMKKERGCLGRAAISLGVAIVGFLILSSVTNGFGSGQNSLGNNAIDKTAAISDSTLSDKISSDKTSSDKTASDRGYEIGSGAISTQRDSIGSTWIKVSVPVINTGTNNLYLSACTLDIENSAGELVETLELVSAFPQVIQPGETGYYFETTTSEKITSAEGLRIIPHVDVKKASVSCERLATSEIKIGDDSFSEIKVSGRVENTTADMISEPYVSVLLYDSSGELLGVAFTIVSSDVQPGEKIGFNATVFGYKISSKDVADYTVYAYPYQIQIF